MLDLACANICYWASIRTAGGMLDGADESKFSDVRKNRKLLISFLNG
jgi:hypothetical protein